MSAFASVYRAPALAQQSYLAREQKRVKRKREASSDEGSRDPSHESIPSDHDEDEAPRVLHPVNKKDPYYVAGHARDQPLPPRDFPHAAVKDPKPDRSVEEELAQLNPPLYIPKVALKAESQSLRRRHLDNLTAILHKCMLNADWRRASRTWGLILRTEFSGRGTDVRQHGRWMIGAEILMRRDETVERIPLDRDDDEDSAHTQLETVLSDEGFRLARDYYERLILQYPHLQRTHHSTINALAIYPAMFSIWIYEVQNRSSRARRKLHSPSAVDTSEMDIDTSMLSDRSTQQRRAVYEIRNRELEQAIPIAQRLDELLVNPPYDTSHELLHARGMVALWLSDLHKELASAKNANTASNRSDDGDLDASLEDVESSASAVKARSERQRARKIFQRLRGAGSELPPDVVEFLEDDDEDQDDE
ncbi:unnamed protein product [Zymoseptoria tritici ST99CH_3D7]|uniref:Uncharacterized protein n=1 Tax=Zymoseptoria tritici (strain ST99CH_3D7) TaxID=1276538 RepID=A0A1X7RUY1_ZYMT9|nr:unnamed protein product [Zymoseptoria tritici ST99CH_3D7]